MNKHVNETVSLAHTAVSLHPTHSHHVPGGGGVGCGGRGGILDQLQFKVRRGVVWTPHSSNTWVGHSGMFEHKILLAGICFCIADSLSHTTCVETDNLLLHTRYKVIDIPLTEFNQFYTHTRPVTLFTKYWAIVIVTALSYYRPSLYVWIRNISVFSFYSIEVTLSWDSFAGTQRFRDFKAS